MRGENTNNEREKNTKKKPMKRGNGEEKESHGRIQRKKHYLVGVDMIPTFKNINQC